MTGKHDLANENLQGAVTGLAMAKHAAYINSVSVNTLTGTTYLPIYGSRATSTTESQVSVPIPRSWKVTALKVNIVTNGLTGGDSLVIRVRDDAANTTSLLTLNSASGTGWKSFTSSQPTVASGSLVAFQIDATGVTAGNATLGAILIEYVEV